LGIMHVREGQMTTGTELLEDAARKGDAPAVRAMEQLRNGRSPAANG